MECDTLKSWWHKQTVIEYQKHEMTLKQDDLVRRISEAFGNKPPPRVEDIVELRGDIHERTEIRRIFGGKRWSELDHVTIEGNYDFLSFFSPIGCHYYLPAYMCAALNAEKDSILRFTVVFHLVPPRRSASENAKSCFEEGLKLFSPEEREVVCQYLGYFGGLDPKDLVGRTSRVALRLFWGKWH